MSAKSRVRHKTRQAILAILLSLFLVFNEFGFVSVQAFPSGEKSFQAMGNVIFGEKTTATKQALRGIPGKDYRAGEIIVKFKPGVDIQSVNRAAKTRVVKKLRESNSQLVKAETTAEMATALESYMIDPRVEYAEPNYIRKAYIKPNDPNLAKQWAIDKMKMPQAWDNVKSWDATAGSGNVKVAIVDTGVDMNHEDLTKLTGGIDCFEGDNVPNDDIGHGTHVAGIAAAVANNGAGVAGVAGGARIMPVKVMGYDPFWGVVGSDEDIAEGIRWAANNGADVINMSLGGYYPSKVLEDAVNYAYSKGVVIVAAAGNERTDEPSYPAAYNHVISVAATDSDDGQAWFSNYGPTIDVSAPGVNIYSTLPNHNNLFGENDYGYLSGTSMASPQVAGLAALILTKYPTLTSDQVEFIIEASADDLGASGVDEKFGFGRINALRAVSMDLDNNTWQKAPLVNNGVSLKGKIYPVNDIDLFKYQLGGKRVKVQLRVPSAIDGRIDIYNYNKQRVKTVNKAGAGGVETEFLDLPAGSYYFKVTDAVGKSSSGFYTLTVKDKDIYESNNTFSQAPLVAGAIYDRLYPKGDVDYFKIKVPLTGTVKISFQSPPVTTIDGKVTLFDSAYNVVAVADANANGKNEYLARQLKAGTYFAKVQNVITKYAVEKEYKLTFDFFTSGRIAVNNGNTVTKTRSVKLYLQAADTLGSVTTMQFRNEGSNTWSQEEPFKTTKDWTLPAGSGVKRVYVRFKNRSGNRYIAADTIKLE